MGKPTLAVHLRLCSLRRHELLLRLHVSQSVRIRSTSCHALAAGAGARHAHRRAAGVLSARHRTHRPIRAGLHAHHRLRLAHVGLARSGDTRMHHGLPHVLRVRRHAGVAV
jgi:hypothetical protein